MRSCPSCGGIIGRDCFNPIECAQITLSINYQQAVEDYKNQQHEKAMNDYYTNQEKEYLEFQQEEFYTGIISSTPVLNTFLSVI